MSNLSTLPSLRGKLVRTTDVPPQHTCTGVWALSDAAHALPDQTSAFSFNLDTPVVPGVDVAATFPISGTYKGWFNLKQLKGPPV